MSYLKDKSFFFETHAQNQETKEQYRFAVVRFEGAEGLSRLYEFDITLMSEDAEIDLDEVLAHPATLYLQTGKKLPVHGILSSIEIINEVDGKIFYKASLVPKLWQLTLYKVSEVYLDMTVPEIIEKVLKEAGLSLGDYDLRLRRKYHRWSYICQYQETHFQFLSRRMEREGVYYFWEQTADGARLVITDTIIAHVDLPEETVVHYSPPSGLEQAVQESAVTQFLSRSQPIPGKVTIQDFNYRKSPPVIEGSYEVPVNGNGNGVGVGLGQIKVKSHNLAGRGEVHIYGEHVKNNKEAEEYAKLRAEGLICRRRVYHGESTSPFLRVGWYFELDRHFRESFNRKYLMVGIEHAGSQAALLSAQVQRSSADEDQRPFYHNSFEAIESDIQYRPELTTPKPKFYGTINAKVESEGSGEYAELDEFGRYKVKMPFDRSDRKGQKASRWVRMAQPYAGPDEGMHFPLRMGAEVLLTFMDGDPDRPIIAAAVPGAEGQSVVADKNSQYNLIKSAGGNLMHMHDQKGKQRILMQSPTSNSWVRIGAYNDPPDPYHIDDGNALSTFKDSTGTWSLQNRSAGVVAKKTSPNGTTQLGDGASLLYHLPLADLYYVGNIGGALKAWNDSLATITESTHSATFTHDSNTYLNTGNDWNTNKPGNNEIKSLEFSNSITGVISPFYIAKISGSYLVFADDEDYVVSSAVQNTGSITVDGVPWLLTQDLTGLTVGSARADIGFHRAKTVVLDVNDMGTVASGTDGIRLKTETNLWSEGVVADPGTPVAASKRYGEFIGWRPADLTQTTTPASGDRPGIGDLLAHFGGDYAPTGLKSRHGSNSAQTMDQAMDAGAIFRVSSLDTFNTQEGNIYDFGGYWNYNLGNSYLEAYMVQSGVELNVLHDYDRAGAGGPNYGSITDLDGSAHFITTDHGGNVWVTKKFSAASYDYSNEMDSLEVKNNCHSISHRYGCQNEEHIYAEGEAKPFTKKWIDEGLGETQEWTYNSNDDLYGYEYKWDNITFLLGFKFSKSAKATAEFEFGTSATFKLSMAAAFSIGIEVAGGVDIKFAGSAKFIIDTGAAINFKLKGSWGGDHTYDFVSGEWSSDLPFTKLKKNADVETEIKTLLLEDAKMCLKNLGMLTTEKGALKLDKKDLNLETHTLCFYA